jgi:hypothetical protein
LPGPRCPSKVVGDDAADYKSPHAPGRMNLVGCEQLRGTLLRLLRDARGLGERDNLGPQARLARPPPRANGRRDTRPAHAHTEHKLQAASKRGAYLKYREVLGEEVREAGRRWGFEPSPSEVEALPDSVRYWLPFPDTVNQLVKEDDEVVDLAQGSLPFVLRTPSSSWTGRPLGSGSTPRGYSRCAVYLGRSLRPAARSDRPCTIPQRCFTIRPGHGYFRERRIEEVQLRRIYLPRTPVNRACMRLHC